MDHKRLERALSKYGTIMHISLPRFKNNKEFKGFGFVEFKTVEDANAALKVDFNPLAADVTTNYNYIYYRLLMKTTKLILTFLCQLNVFIDYAVINKQSKQQ